MIPPRDAMADYLRQLAFHCLARDAHEGAPALSAGDLAERMGVTAQAEGHPPACWRAINGREVYGALRTLERQQLAARISEVHNPRAGRTEPTWRLHCFADRADAWLPHPPVAESAAAAPDADRVQPGVAWSALDRQQLDMLLEHLDWDGTVTRLARLITQARAG
jgi:hypothetical protein